jgi:hypothetical protein
MKKYSVEQIEKFTTLSDRQIRNKLKELKPKFPNDIIGGGTKGKKSKYFVNSNILEFVTERKYNLLDNEYQKRRTDLISKIKEDKTRTIFEETKWDFFCGLTPIKSMTPQQLINLIKHPKIHIFYSIHQKVEDLKNHIHFVVEVLDKSFDIDKHLNSIRVKKVHDVKPYNESIKNDCFDYLMIQGKHKNRLDQFRIEYGTL